MANVNKKITLLCFTFFGLIGSWAGASLDHNNWFGIWSSIIGIIGSLIGIWVGILIGNYIDS